MKSIGRYTVLSRLGRGGMSTVYKVAMPVTEKIVALKLLDPPEILAEIIGMDELRRYFLAEAVAMANLSHPHIADVWDCDEQDGRPFYIMEYFCNNLGTLIGEPEDEAGPSRPLRPEQVFRYGAQILEGIACLHQAGIVHRDIKPGNVMVTDHHLAKIADFGLALWRQTPLPSPEQIKIGSLAYAPPEQRANPDEVDGRADLYSLGVTLHRLFFGCLPGGATLTAAGDDSSPLATLLMPFFDKACAPRPGDRYATAIDMAEAYTALAGQWRSEKKDFCEIVLPTLDEPVPEPTARLRHQPKRIAGCHAAAQFGLGADMQPRRFFVNEFVDKRDGTVTDRATGLVWQRRPHPQTLPWPQAGPHIDGLNRQRFAGRGDWRLPTVDELLSLLSSRSDPTALCGEPVVEVRGKWLWSADRRGKNTAWYVCTDPPFVGWQDDTCRYAVLAVASGG